MGDLSSKKLIVLKGVLFALLISGGSALILSEAPNWRVLFALAIVIWALVTLLLLSILRARKIR
jgi:hypothetical protein